MKYKRGDLIISHYTWPDEKHYAIYLNKIDGDLHLIYDLSDMKTNEAFEDEFHLIKDSKKCQDCIDEEDCTK